MSLKDKALGLIKRYGAPAKFAANLVLGAVLPGSPAVVELVGKVLDYAHDAAKDHGKEDKLPPATAEDLKRVEAVLDVLGGDLSALMAQVAGLESLPAVAAQVLEVALATDARCQGALHRLDEIARGFDRLEQQNARLLEGQGYAAGMIAEMLPLVRRLAGVADFVEDLRAAGAPIEDFRAQLHDYQNGARAFGQGQVDASGKLFESTTRARPSSGAAATALAAVQAAGHEFGLAEKNLARAARLRPQDAELGELHRRVTVATGGTPSGPSRSEGPATAAVKVGDTLDGWRLEALLGQGGWGQVFRARRGNEVRALKVMRPDLSSDPAFVERFKGEILVLAGLRGHKHLVEIHGFGCDAGAGCWYFVMELVDGLSLDAHLSQRGPVSVEEALPMFVRLAEALGAAHGRGVVHRDVKPANILLRKLDASPVLVDFGLAAQAEGARLTQTGASAGYTATFAAPEQLRGKPADARSDVYSLAASFYYALTYDKPDRREPDQFEPNHAPEPLGQVLEGALHAKPERRPANAAALAAALRALASAPAAKTAPVVGPGPASVAWVTAKTAPVVDPGPASVARVARPTEEPVREIHVKSRGTWFTRPSNQPDADWKEVTQTPARVTVKPGEVYRLNVDDYAPDADLAEVANLGGLTAFQGLYLKGWKVTDGGLAHLRHLTALRELHLRGCDGVTNAGLAHLRGLTALQSLSLTYCRTGLAFINAILARKARSSVPVVQVGLAHLRDLAALQKLDLTYCEWVTDTELAHLRGLTTLQKLNLSYCDKVTDTGLAHLRGLSALQKLSLTKCKRVTDVGLLYLRDLTALRELDLGRCKRVTDAGLAYLRGLATLQKLDLMGCERVTGKGVARLNEALPICSISR